MLNKIGVYVLQCTNCSHHVAAGTKFCTKCGQSLVTQNNPTHFCPQCGTKREIELKFCTKCGFNYSLSQKAQQETAASNDRMHHHHSSGYTKIDGSIATFGQRFLATLIDVVITFVFMFFFGLLFFWDSYDPSGAMQFWGILLGFVYKAGMESSSYQGTIGKILMGIKVAGLEGNRISLGAAIGRYFASWVSAIPLGFGYLMALFSQRNQTLHDKMAGTVVRSK
ncbi:RDD family protein [Fictibacillus sp. JL2B1089]|uniref:RDD family protein n=1 Tax=Fictibacillus sp. JL2B1089 TaxID=3399565 RepID=UPI003A866233